MIKWKKKKTFTKISTKLIRSKISLKKKFKIAKNQQNFYGNNPENIKMTDNQLLPP